MATVGQLRPLTDIASGNLSRQSLWRVARSPVGDVAVIERPEYPGIYYIKRITEVRHESNQIFVSSDNPEGTDSRQWGWLPVSSVQAIVVSRVRKAKK